MISEVVGTLLNFYSEHFQAFVSLTWYWFDSLEIGIDKSDFELKLNLALGLTVT